MPYRNKEDEREFQRKHYLANKKLYKNRAAKSRKRVRRRNQQYVRTIKAGICIDCGKKYHYCQMDFDHIENNKEAAIGRLVPHSSLKKLQQEIDKCELICANCHRLRTWKRLGGIAQLAEASDLRSDS